MSGKNKVGSQLQINQFYTWNKDYIRWRTGIADAKAISGHDAESIRATRLQITVCDSKRRLSSLGSGQSFPFGRRCLTKMNPNNESIQKNSEV